MTATTTAEKTCVVCTHFAGNKCILYGTTVASTFGCPSHSGADMPLYLPPPSFVPQFASPLRITQPGVPGDVERADIARRNEAYMERDEAHRRELETLRKLRERTGQTRHSLPA